MKYFILVIALMFASGCATLERFIDDAYDGDPRMTEIKEDVDSLKDKLKNLGDDIKARLEARLNILREEAEMLGDLKKAEFRIKYTEIQEQIGAAKEVIDAAKAAQ